MKFTEFESILSAPRMSRYQTACGGDTRKAMTLYRMNLRLSQEMFTVISCFEVGLRNSIDHHYQGFFGPDWLRGSVAPGGMFDNRGCYLTAQSVRDLIRAFGMHYSNGRAVSELGFGFWRYLFATNQYTAGGRSLLQIFPAKPRSTASMQYNQSFVFNQLASINAMRNRIAHHEPISFLPGLPIKDTTLARQQHGLVLQLFR